MRFLVDDIFLPTPDRISIVATGETEVEGIIHDFSDSGSKSCVFALVDVLRKETVVVPVEKLHVVTRREFEADP